MASLGSRVSSTPDGNERQQTTHPFIYRSRARFILISKNNEYLPWVCAAAVCLLVVFLLQLFLPGSVMEIPPVIQRSVEYLGFLNEFGSMDFGENLTIGEANLFKFEEETEEGVAQWPFGKRERYPYRRPIIAMVSADLVVGPQQLMMVTLASVLQSAGYRIEVYSLKDGPVNAVWRHVGIQAKIIETNIAVDWLNYDGILIYSLEATEIVLCLMQEPFKSVPLIWTIHEQTLANRLRQYISDGQYALVDYWKKIISRADVVVFPNYVLPTLYSVCSAGNYFVIPGSPADSWGVDDYMPIHVVDFIIVIVGSQITYKGLWLEHALILMNLLPLHKNLIDKNSTSQLRITILSGASTSGYNRAVEIIAKKLGFPEGVVEHVGIENAEDALRSADLVIYGSFYEERSFPSILLRAMSLGKLIVAPDHRVIRRYVRDGVNGYLYPKRNVKILKYITMNIVSQANLSSIDLYIASTGKEIAKNLLALESNDGYASLLRRVLKLPSEVATAQPVPLIHYNLKSKWKWELFETVSDSIGFKTTRNISFIEAVEKQWNRARRKNKTEEIEIFYSCCITEEEKSIETEDEKKRIEDEELKDRTEQPWETWEELHRDTKKADRAKNDVRSRGEGELERTGQPLCIYEPYVGEGSWPFLHNTSLYRGVVLSAKSRRPEQDDIDAMSHLPLLNNSYYRDNLGEVGAFFAIASRIDHVHRNAWIGFQSWRLQGREKSLSEAAEIELLDDIEAGRHGDALYFWARMDMDPRNPWKRDFWSFCNSINAGNCKAAFSMAMKEMYGVNDNASTLPPMPTVADTWSVMHSWALPTHSFLEFVMFSRMFADALDKKFYDMHNRSGQCYLSLYKDKHCYTRILELLINVWAYHSARRMVYVDPETGFMQEQHDLNTRKGKMWIQWFDYQTLKGMDEDLAEEYEVDRPARRWLWPTTGEVFCETTYNRESEEKRKIRELKKERSRERIARMRKKYRQKALGKYIKPSPEVVLESSF